LGDFGFVVIRKKYFLLGDHNDVLKVCSFYDISSDKVNKRFLCSAPCKHDGGVNINEGNLLVIIVFSSKLLNQCIMYQVEWDYFDKNTDIVLSGGKPIHVSIHTMKFKWMKLTPQLDLVLRDPRTPNKLTILRKQNDYKPEFYRITYPLDLMQDFQSYLWWSSRCNLLLVTFQPKDRYSKKRVFLGFKINSKINEGMLLQKDDVRDHEVMLSLEVRPDTSCPVPRGFLSHDNRILLFCVVKRGKLKGRTASMKVFIID
jgi:hypothetical protein